MVKPRSPLQYKRARPNQLPTLDALGPTNISTAEEPYPAKPPIGNPVGTTPGYSAHPGRTRYTTTLAKSPCGRKRRTPIRITHATGNPTSATNADPVPGT